MNPALGPWAEGHRENGGWAYPRKYQRAANATIDRVELSLEAVPWPGNITVQVLAVTSEQSIGIHCPSGLLPIFCYFGGSGSDRIQYLQNAKSVYNQ